MASVLLLQLIYLGIGAELQGEAAQPKIWACCRMSPSSIPSTSESEEGESEAREEETRREGKEDGHTCSILQTQHLSTATETRAESRQSSVPPFKAEPSLQSQVISEEVLEKVHAGSSTSG
ncbi:hypothetical protein EYF80_009664 [Liparis tanakae]|uniref:Uncharacterized protein n=1 Tax=Liparis tanakae TaxID=230148 RepID=A0A4Z2IQ34_9TELE|nr:hypothetical protein EYF80_009664 [Liparis tanakae]